MKKRRRIVLVLFLLLLGGALALRPIRMRVVACFRGESFYKTWPTGCWREQALEHDRLRKERAANGRHFGGVILVDAGEFPPRAARWSDSIVSFFNRVFKPGKHDFRVFEGDPSAVAVLIDLLADSNAGVQTSAAEGLAKIGPPAAPAIPALIELLLHDDPSPRGATQDALGKIGAAAVAPLLDHLKSHEDKADGVITTLWLIGPDAAPAIPTLIGRLKTKPSLVVARALSRIGARAVPPLLETVKDPNSEVRWHATGALAEIDGDRDLLVPHLIKLLKDESGVVRQSAAAGLGRHGANYPVAVSALIEALKDDEGYARREAVDALYFIGPKARAAMPSLRQLLVEERDHYIRGCIQQALTRIGNE
jgi:HEAT repeat protein